MSELKKPGRNWRNTIGIFTDKQEMLAIFDEAMKLREADRKKARQKPAKPRRSKQ
jgi:hypothetical protein